MISHKNRPLIKIIAILISFIFAFENIGYGYQDVSILRPRLLCGKQDKDRANAFGRELVAEDFRNELVGTFLEGEVLDFEFDDEGRVSDVSVLRNNGERAILINQKSLEFRRLYPGIYSNLDQLKRAVSRSRHLGLDTLLRNKDISLKGRNIIQHIWFVMSSSSLPMPGKAPYFEYKGVKIPGTSFGSIPILPIALLKKKIWGFDKNETRCILEQALMHEMNAIYNAYYSELSAEASHDESRDMEISMTFAALENNRISKKRYLPIMLKILPGFGIEIVRRPRSVLAKFNNRYGLGNFSFPQRINRHETGDGGYLDMEGSDNNLQLNSTLECRKCMAERRLDKEWKWIY